MQVTVTQVRKWFHNLNVSGDKYRANVAHSAIRQLQAGNLTDAIKTLASIGYPFSRHTPAKMKPRIESIYTVSAGDAKQYNDTHKQSKITGFSAVVFGQSNWRLETTGKLKPKPGEKLPNRDTLQTFVSYDAENLPHIQAVTISNQKPAKRLTRVKSLVSVIARAQHLIDTAPQLDNHSRRLRQLTRARKMLAFAALALPQQNEARERYNAALVSMTRMENAILWKQKATNATKLPEAWKTSQGIARASY